MRQLFPLLILSVLMIQCKNNKNTAQEQQKPIGFQSIEVKNTTLNYPEVRKDETVIDQYFGTAIKDPYRWLEDDNSVETGEWVQAENKLTNAYMSKIDFRDDVRKRMEELYDYTKYSAPFKEGNNYFYFKKEGLQNQAVLYITKDVNDDGRIFLDPNDLSTDGTTSISSISVSNDGKLFGYAESDAGSDWKTIKVRDIETGKLLADKINWAKFTGISWQGDGFYYGAYPAPEDGEELSSANQGMKIFYHKIGTDQSEDTIIYEEPNNQKKYFGASVTDDERFLLINGGMGTSGNDLRIKDLSQPNSKLLLAKKDMETNASVIGNVNDEIYVITNKAAPNMRVVKFSANNPSDWKDVLPESDKVLTSVSMAGGKLFAKYIEDVKHKVYQYDLNGKLEHEVKLPGQGTVYGFDGKKEDKDIFYTFTSLTQPPTIYQYNVESGESTVFKAPEIDFDGSAYETKQVFYTSKDGTKVPMYIVHKKGLELNGNNPALLYAYGGFDISIMPSFNAIQLAWLEQGGIYAQANIRGGSEYGSKWHDGGRLLNKQNVFDDFIAAAEYLIDEKYTSPKKIAINGRSNGGLLVGAVMIQRPDLFGACIPAVGVLDMLRYEKFTIGYAWASDYGSASEEKHFRNLLSYSPLHNVKDGTAYPPTMVVTGDHDDRVVPAHSFKFTSRLQEAQAGTNPILIRVDIDSGHGAGKPTEKILDEYADVYSFAMYNLGVRPTY